MPITSNEEVKADTEITTLRFDVPQLVDDATIYEFLNTTLATDSIRQESCDAIIAREYYPIFSDKSEAIGILRRIKNISLVNIDFMYKQSLYVPQFELKKENFKTEKRLIAPDTCNMQDREYWRNIRKQFGSFCSISLPLFSEDREMVVIRLSYSCGSLCGYGGIYVFKKEDDIWKPFTAIDQWMS
nr:hypothetical protein [uncultured Flavobacterium sp.]